MMSAMSSRASKRLERAESQDVVADVVEQVLLLGDRQHHVLDRDDFMDDVADFLARALGVELGQRGEIDRFDQRAEDLRFRLKIVCPTFAPAAAEPAGRPPAWARPWLAVVTAFGRATGSDWIVSPGFARLPNIPHHPLADATIIRERVLRFLANKLGHERFEQASLGLAQFPTSGDLSGEIGENLGRACPSVRSRRSSGHCSPRRQTAWDRAE